MIMWKQLIETYNIETRLRYSAYKVHVSTGTNGRIRRWY